MTLEEAIRVLREGGTPEELFTAGVLAFQALQRVRKMRDLGDVVATEPLLDETEE